MKEKGETKGKANESGETEEIIIIIKKQCSLPPSAASRVGIIILEKNGFELRCPNVVAKYRQTTPYCFVS